MIGLLRAGRWPLFLRIFGLMLLTLLLVQVLNLALVLLVPPPQPAVTTIDHVVVALRDARPTDKLRVKPGAIDPSTTPRGPEAGLRRVLARRLAVPEGDVRVRFRWPEPNGWLPMLPRASIMARRWDGPPPDFEPPGNFVLIGDFAVSARIDGRWRTVELLSPGMAPWRRRALIWLLVAMVVVAPVAWLLARALARPIGLFAEAARRLGRNPKAPPLELAGPPEIREATEAFNEMQGRLNRYVEDRTTIMAAIAHDLRTPLMRLGLRLETAPAEMREACEADIRDMEQMVAAVMSFVRDMTHPARRQRVDLRSLTESIADHFGDLGHAVRLAPGAPLILEADPAALKALLNNLVGNAVKYADGAEITLALQDGHAVIEVLDEGPGMSAQDLEQAFEPFFRAEKSRSRDTGGIGLGLASVRAVARAHGGYVTLANRPEGGLVARVRLPV